MSRLRHLKKFATLDNNQRIDALYQTIEEMAGGGPGETIADITHHHDDRYTPRETAEQAQAEHAARLAVAEQLAAVTRDQNMVLERRVGALESSPAPVPIIRPAAAPDTAVTEALAARIGRVEMATEELRNRPQQTMPMTVTPEPMPAPDERVDGLVGDVAVLAAEIGAARDDLAALAERISGAENRISQPQVPANDDDDLPAFLRRDSSGPSFIGSPVVRAAVAEPADDARLLEIEQQLSEISSRLDRMQPNPAQQLAASAVLDRMTVMEQRLASYRPTPVAPPPTQKPMTIAEAARLRIAASDAPPLRVVEAAHLARSGQDVPLTLMERLGVAMGCDWEAAATNVIRRNDEAALIAVETYALQMDAQRRIMKGEPADAVTSSTIAAIEAIGG